MRVINKKKFARGIIAFTFLITFIAIASSNITLSHGELQFKERYVDGGETLWSIATSEHNTNTYYSNKDVREVISDIKKINNLTSSVLQIGQKLEIPTI